MHKTRAPTYPTKPIAELSDEFATYFSSKVTNIRSSISSVSSSFDDSSVLNHNSSIHNLDTLSNFSPVSTEEITELILSSKNKQCSLDPIPTVLLKKCIHSLAPIITNIANLSLTNGSFPSVFKHAIISPLLKKPSLDKETLSNYRPISNLSFLSKLLERVVLKRLLTHLSYNNLFNEHQSAYTKHHSTETVLLSLHNDIISAMATQRLSGLCLLDLSSAFDTIDHNILLQRLSSSFGISQTALNWFSSYLLNRTYSVLIQGISSSTIKLMYGVPQGSVLGPVLFNLYTTPLSSVISSHNINHHLYADDTQLFTCFSSSDFLNSSQTISCTFEAISNWMKENFLALNPNKTEFIVFGTYQQLSKLDNPTLHLSGDINVESSSSVKNLGVTFDPCLSFHEHVTKLSQTCFYHIRDLRRLRSCLDLETASTIGTALVQSKLDYCNSLFFNLPSYEIQRLQFIQNSLARAIYCKSKFSHITPILQSLHWLRIKDRIEYKIIKLTYKILVNLAPNYLSSLISVKPPGSTRASKLIRLNWPCNELCHSTLSHRAFQYAAPHLWNALPSYFRVPDSLNPNKPSLSYDQFLDKLKTYIFLESYSIN